MSNTRPRKTRKPQRKIYHTMELKLVGLFAVVIQKAGASAGTADISEQCASGKERRYLRSKRKYPCHKPEGLYSDHGLQRSQ